MLLTLTVEDLSAALRDEPIGQVLWSRLVSLLVLGVGAGEILTAHRREVGTASGYPG